MRERERERDRETERERKRKRERDRQRDRETEGYTSKLLGYAQMRHVPRNGNFRNYILSFSC